MKNILTITLLIFTACNTITTLDKQLNPAEEIILDRPHYQMTYLSDWEMDSTDSDFDLDSYFIFNSASKNGCINYFIFNVPVDEKEHLDAQVTAHLEKVVKNGEVTYFEKWGHYKGHGATIKGKLMGILNGEVKIFAHANDSASFLVVSQIYESDKEIDLPGLDLMEKTFRTK